MDNNEVFAAVLKRAQEITNDLEGALYQMRDMIARGAQPELDSLVKASDRLVEASMWIDRARRRATI